MKNRVVPDYRKGENIKLVMERSRLKSPIYIGDTKGDAESAKKAGSLLYGHLMALAMWITQNTPLTISENYTDYWNNKKFFSHFFKIRGCKQFLMNLCLN